MKLKELSASEMRSTQGGGLIPIMIGMAILGYKVEAMEKGNKWYQFPPFFE